MACWAVALVMIITGVCLGLTIPSSAAEDGYEGKIEVAFNGESNTYTNIVAVKDALAKITTTEDKPVTITLLSNVTSSDVSLSLFGYNWCIDLNGYVWSVDNFSLGNYAGGTLTITDSNSTAVHYVTYIGNGEYEFIDKQLPGRDSPIYGGVIAMKQGNIFNMTNQSEDGEVTTMVFDKGTILGNGLTWVGNDPDSTPNSAANVVIKEGANLQFYFNAYAAMDSDLSRVSFLNSVGSKINIEGGNIYGKIVGVDTSKEEEAYQVFDLDKKDRLPDWITISNEIEMKAQYDDAGNFLCYSAVDADGNPTTTPNEPIAEAEPTNNNNNLVALIVLGAAAAVMVVGVSVIIMVNAKRRKKVA